MDFNFNIIDRVVNAISPERGLKRAQARALNEMLRDNLRRYDGAGFGRRTAGWRATGGSANMETRMDLVTLRYRSRDLVRNNPYAKRAIQAIATNTIGLGIRATPTPNGANKRAVKAMLAAWKLWAETTECDYDGQDNFYGIQRLCMRSVAESGEVLIRRRWVEGKALPIQLQVLEPDLLDHSRDQPMIPGQSYCIQGVEFDKDGKRAGYWLFPFHPGEGGVSLSQFVPAKDIVHIYYKERPGQVRGVPFGASAAISLRDFDEYEQAQLIRQKIAACFSIFVQDSTADGGTPSGTVKTGENREKVEPGIIEYLPNGKTMQFATPPGVQNYDEYGSSILRKIAVGFGVSYEIISGDLSNVNFSSGRMGWIEFHRLISEWQTLMMIPQMCDPIWGWFAEAAAIMGSGNINVKATWTPPRREMIDPSKEIKAMSEAVRNGFVSYSEMVRQMGGDPAEVLAQLGADYKAFDAAEMMLSCDPRYDAARKIPPDEELPGGDPNGNDGDEETPKQKKARLRKMRSQAA